MSFITNNPGIDLIIGPMFAGKSTELIRRLNIYSELGLKTLYINSSLDKRSDKVFSTHNPSICKIGKIEAKKCKKLLFLFKKVHGFKRRVAHFYPPRGIVRFPRF